MCAGGKRCCAPSQGEQAQRLALQDGTSLGPTRSYPLLRHPAAPAPPADKFVARFGRRLAAQDRDRILARVARTAQQLNAISAALPK